MLPNTTSASAVSHRRRRTQENSEQRFDRKLPHIGPASRKPLVLEDEDSLERRRKTHVVDKILKAPRPERSLNKTQHTGSVRQ